MKLLERDLDTKENIRSYSLKREEYFRTRVNKYSVQKNYLLDNPYNQRIIQKLNLKNESESSKKLESFETKYLSDKNISNRNTSGKSMSQINVISKIQEDTLPKFNLRLASAKNVRDVQSAAVKRLEPNYLNTVNTIYNYPTSPTRLLTYDYTTTIGNIQKTQPIRIMSASPHQSDRKSILNETTKSKFNRCIEINKEFLLKNNPNMNLFQVAEIFGSSKLIHYKNINI
jgi:hypothetical protein